MIRVWHGTRDAPRSPARVSPADRVVLEIGTWPIELGQSVKVECTVRSASGSRRVHTVEAEWQRNEGANSYWRAEIGTFAAGDRVSYIIRAHSPAGATDSVASSFRVGPSSTSPSYGTSTSRCTETAAGDRHAAAIASPG